MEKDKFSAIWVSHSSISDFLKCPRSYYLKNVYKNAASGNKLAIASPPLSLGQAVHEVVEALSVVPREERLTQPLDSKYDTAWEKVSGKKGGFTDPEQEQKYKAEGWEMIRKVINNPGPVKNLAIKISEELPHFWLSQEDNIILCGKIDWLEYLPETDSVHIIDFKTGKQEEEADSLQLPIYYLLVENSQERSVSKASYWYLRLYDRPSEQILPNLEESREKILEIAKKIKLARQLERYRCPGGESGCRECLPYEAVLKGEAEFVGEDKNMRKDVYILPPKKTVLASSKPF